MWYWKSYGYIGGYYGRYSKEIRNGFYGWSIEKIKNYFADKAKHIVKQEIEDYHDGEWKRDCTKNLFYFHGDLTIADVYKAYDELKGRKARA